MSNIPNLSPHEASSYLKERWGISRAVPTLAKMRCTTSTGPVFIKIGRGVLYPRNGLDAFAEAMLSEPMQSTAKNNFRAAA